MQHSKSSSRNCIPWSAASRMNAQCDTTVLHSGLTAFHKILPKWMDAKWKAASHFTQKFLNKFCYFDKEKLFANIGETMNKKYRTTTYENWHILLKRVVLDIGLSTQTFWMTLSFASNSCIFTVKSKYMAKWWDNFGHVAIWKSQNTSQSIIKLWLNFERIF